jgi:hypothetical protein
MNGRPDQAEQEEPPFTTLTGGATLDGTKGLDQTPTSLWRTAVTPPHNLAPGPSPFAARTTPADPMSEVA